MITLTLKDADYPKLLKEISGPPAVLYIKTQLPHKKIFNYPMIAVIGTRNISSYGKEVTRNLTRDLVKRGITIVSGLARGVDIYAHRTALENNGLTIAVLGSGLDRIYPPENVDIAKQISIQGALVSEFPLGTKAIPSNFPRRNRIISGLSIGVVVIEAAKKSGTMITVSRALEQGREVFAVPGPITSYYSAGTAELLKNGAKPVTSVEDILEEFPQL